MIKKIISGGQSGVDRAALDVALKLGIAHGGWCPRGRRAEDGPIDLRYQLNECDHRDYSVRTELNVRDSDGTLILYWQPMIGGTRLTDRLARRHRKPLYRVELGTLPLPEDFHDWLRYHEVGCLNIAGPRESSSPGIYNEAKLWLHRFLPSGIATG